MECPRRTRPVLGTYFSTLKFTYSEAVFYHGRRDFSHQITNPNDIFCQLIWKAIILSGRFWARPAQSKVVKMKFLDFSYWASSTPWGNVLSLKTFCRNPVLSWAIRYSVFQSVKFASNFQKWAGKFNQNSWHLVVKFGHNEWF